MKCKRLKLDLAPLYQVSLNRKYGVLGYDNEYWEWEDKFKEENMRLSNFFQEKCDLNNFIYLMIFIFKFKYPNFIRLVVKFASSDQNWDNKESLKSTYYSGLSFLEKVITVLWIDKSKDEMYSIFDDYYIKEFEFVLTQKCPISIIEDAILGLDYSKSVIGDSYIYNVLNSPIDVLRVKNNVFTIKIRHEKAIIYRD